MPGVSLQYCLCTPELQWQSRGKCRFLYWEIACRASPRGGDMWAHPYLQAINEVNAIKVPPLYTPAPPGVGGSRVAPVDLAGRPHPTLPCVRAGRPACVGARRRHVADVRPGAQLRLLHGELQPGLAQVHQAGGHDCPPAPLEVEGALLTCRGMLLHVPHTRSWSPTRTSPNVTQVVINSNLAIQSCRWSWRRPTRARP